MSVAYSRTSSRLRTSWTVGYSSALIVYRDPNCYSYKCREYRSWFHCQQFRQQKTEQGSFCGCFLDDRENIDKGWLILIRLSYQVLKPCVQVQKQVTKSLVGRASARSPSTTLVRRRDYKRQVSHQDRKHRKTLKYSHAERGQPRA